MSASDIGWKTEDIGFGAATVEYALPASARTWSKALAGAPT
jgi:hypothetical protein